MSVFKTKRALARYVANPSLTNAAILSILESIDTPKSLAVWLLFSSGEHDQLTAIDLQVSDYLTRDSFDLDYQAVSLLAKYEGLTTTFDKKAVALKKFSLMEEQCRLTNLRMCDRSFGSKNPRLVALHLAMQRKIDLTLGRLEPEEWLEHCAWGPGVSTSLKGSDTSASRKFQSETGITPRLRLFLEDLNIFDSFPLWFRGHKDLSPVGGNDVITVRKNSKTDRVIAIEPGLNLFFQKGVGKLIRKRMLKAGINLNDPDINQSLAQASSVDNTLATVDFSSASDTIASSMVESVLPSDWFTLLDTLRCTHGMLDSKPFRWNKFSSMGNGFTWELESLIFWSAAYAVCQELNLPTGQISVYGDDVVIPVGAIDLYRSFCEYLGFSLNLDKTFSSGPFRESCGGHFWAGFSVKPFYFRKKLDDAFSVYKLANSVRMLAYRRNSHCGCERRFLACYRTIVDGLPSTLKRLKIPLGAGDGGLISNWDEASPSRPRFGWDGWRFLIARYRTPSTYHEHVGHLCAKLASGSTVEPWFITTRASSLPRVLALECPLGVREPISQGNIVSLRDRGELRLATQITADWPCFGPWV